MNQKQKVPNLTLEDTFVLITISGGVVNEAVFYFEAEDALIALASFVKEMDIERQDAVIYNRKGFFANAKDFLDDNDQYIIDPYIFDRK